MKKIISPLLALGMCITPVSTLLMVQPSWGQVQSSKAQQAERLLKQGRQQTQQQQHQQAIQTLQQVLTLARELQDKKLEALALNDLGFNHNRIGERQQALEYYNQSLPLYRSVGDRTGEATTLSNIGLVYSDLGQKQEALKYYNQSLPLSRAVGDRTGEAITLNNIGGVYNDLGDKQEALKFYNQSLPLSRSVGDRTGVATTLNNIGRVYDDLGQKQEALKYLSQSLPLRRALGDRTGEATTLNNIGGVYDDLGQKQEALKFYNQSLPLSRSVGDRTGVATTLNNIGGVYFDLGQKQKALEYFNQSLPLSRSVGDRSLEATTLNNIGRVYSALGQKQEALKYLNQSLPLRRSVGDPTGVATTLNNIGKVYDDLGQKQEALKYLNQSLPLSRAVGDRSGEAVILGNIGGLYRDTNRPTDAISYLEKSVKITLELRQGLQRQYRQKFLQAKDGGVTTLVNILIDQKQYDKAFEWVNLFTTAELADYTRLINAKVANPQVQQALDKWNRQNQQLEALRQKLQDNFSEDLSGQVRQLEAQVYKDAKRISQDFPEVAELFETTPTDIKKLKSSIPIGTVVVQPVLLNNSIAIFVLTKDRLNVVKTPIDASKFDQLLTQYSKQVQNEGDDSYIETGSSPLYDILIRPVEKEIQALSPKELSIIAGGKLRYLPFETLYDKQKQEFLIKKYPVNYLTRISTRSLESPEAQKLVRQQQTVLAFGNPVPREPQNLPGAEEEVKNITQLFPTSQAYLGNDATLNNFKTYASRFPLLHLATHGCFQNEDCKKLNLKKNTLLFADTQFDIANAALLGLQGTQLLTLSACQTAQATNSSGEGIGGVAYIFERAGAKAVMAALWAVNDKATQSLMIEFYRNIKQGMSKGEALQKAKLKQIERHPYYWSPFVLIGDAR
ncbi:TPR repeat-containing protein [Kalymmatonema gypsitolerans NIES-4073]|nr:TPR repeat-containing protein [Scytonema sp. NIES-4073]